MQKTHPRESETIEYKQQVTDTFLKSVSAFANCGTGQIIFGINDRTRQAEGLRDPEKAASQIENRLNDSLNPIPDYRIEIDDENKLVRLTVYKGDERPYYWKQTAYIRKGTSSVPMSSKALEDLILNRDNRSYDTLPAPSRDYSFSILADEAKEKLGLDHFGSDSQKSLGIKDLAGHVTVAGALLADENSYPGIDMVVMENEDLYGERKQAKGISVLQQLSEAMDFFIRYYRKERVSGNLSREEVFLVPEKAFREAISNALVHRTWNTFSDITVRFYQDRIEVLSPGGLPPGISELEYLYNELSVPRNFTLAYLFLRFGLIEKLGTGIGRILRSYSGEFSQPSFQFSENSIKVVLPVLGRLPELDSNEKDVIRAFRSRSRLTRAEIEKKTGFSRSKLSKVLKQLTQKNVLLVVGGGRSTQYQLADGIPAD